MTSSTEGIQSLNWGKIMKTIVEDPDGFLRAAAGVSDQSDGEEDDDTDDEDENFGGLTMRSDFSESSDDSVKTATCRTRRTTARSWTQTRNMGKDWSDLEAEAARAMKTGLSRKMKLRRVVGRAGRWRGGRDRHKGSSSS